MPACLALTETSDIPSERGRNVYLLVSISNPVGVKGCHKIVAFATQLKGGCFNVTGVSTGTRYVFACSWIVGSGVASNCSQIRRLICLV
jgi:hypothetical protein